MPALVRFALACIALSAAACSSSSPDPIATPQTDGGIQGSTSDAGGDAGHLGADAAAAGDSGLTGEAAACQTITSTAHTAVCAACMQTKCTTTCAVCANYPGCMALWNCINNSCVNDAGVTSTQCGTGCATQSLTDGTAIADFSAFVEGLGNAPGCVSTNCAAECPQGP